MEVLSEKAAFLLAFLADASRIISFRKVFSKKRKKKEKKLAIAHRLHLGVFGGAAPAPLPHFLGLKGPLIR